MMRCYTSVAPLLAEIVTLLFICLQISTVQACAMDDDTDCDPHG